MQIKNLVVLGLALSLGLTSCKKDETNNPTQAQIDAQAQKAAEDKGQTSNIDDESSVLADYASNIDPRSAGGRTEGTVLGAGNTSYDVAAKTLTIDFGTTNAMCTDGRKRRGKVFVRFTAGEPRSLQHTVQITQENYFVNDIRVEGTRTDVVQSQINLSNGAISSNRKVTISNRKLTFTDNTTITENGTYDFVITATINLQTLQVSNGQWTATGGTTGKNRQNMNYIASIVTPLVAKVSCNNAMFPIQGNFDVNVVGLADKVVVDYGNGTCDKSYTISYRGQTVTITL